MKLNYEKFKNQIMEIFENNNGKITYTTGIISAILMLYYNPLLYLTVIGVGATYGLVKHFEYDLNIDFKMKQIKNINYDKYDQYDNKICEKNINIEKIINTELKKEIENSSNENIDILEKLNISENDEYKSDSDDSIADLKKSIFLKSNDNKTICVGEYFTSSYKT